MAKLFCFPMIGTHSLSIDEVVRITGISEVTVRRILLTLGLWTSPMCVKIEVEYKKLEGLGLKEKDRIEKVACAEGIKISPKSVQQQMPNAEDTIQFLQIQKQLESVGTCVEMNSAFCDLFSLPESLSPAGTTSDQMVSSAFARRKGLHHESDLPLPQTTSLLRLASEV
ncbi:hypothetical protein CQR41_05215 [Enterococcus faecium]|nr:hypothetical protein CQR41_05215 [Enterococcus faecium]PHL18355.1 hypothetical protein CQR39_07410 [Enterococcus faecium]